jgi:hypothetical protein
MSPRASGEGAGIDSDAEAPAFCVILRCAQNDTKKEAESWIARSSALYSDPHLHPLPYRERRQKGRTPSAPRIAIGAGHPEPGYAKYFGQGEVRIRMEARTCAMRSRSRRLPERSRRRGEDLPALRVCE